MKLLTLPQIATAAALLAAAPASAASVFVMDFDGGSGDGGTQHSSGGPNGSYYEAGDYIFSPSNLQSSLQCYDGNCVQEFQNGAIGEFTRSDGGDFDFLGFYFSLQGRGGTDDDLNFVTVEAEKDGTGIVPIFQIALADLLTSTLPYFDVVWADGGDGDPNAVCKDDQNVTFDKTVRVCNQKGYFVSVLDGAWNGVDLVRFTSSSTALTRIDNLSAIPLPAAAWFLIAGLGALGGLTRRSGKAI